MICDARSHGRGRLRAEGADRTRPPQGQDRQGPRDAHARLGGKYLLSSSDPDLSAEDIALGYKNLREAERSFRDLKTTLELRPVFHCWLALLLIRLAERQSGQSWRRIATELSRLHLVTLQGPAGAVQQTTLLTQAQHEILAALEIVPPPRITALDPA